MATEDVQLAIRNAGHLARMFWDQYQAKSQIFGQGVQFSWSEMDEQRQGCLTAAMYELMNQGIIEYNKPESIGDI